MFMLNETNMRESMTKCMTSWAGPHPFHVNLYTCPVERDGVHLLTSAASSVQERSESSCDKADRDNLPPFTWIEDLLHGQKTVMRCLGRPRKAFLWPWEEAHLWSFGVLHCLEHQIHSVACIGSSWLLRHKEMLCTTLTIAAILFAKYWKQEFPVHWRMARRFWTTVLMRKLTCYKGQWKWWLGHIDTFVLTLFQ